MPLNPVIRPNQIRGFASAMQPWALPPSLMAYIQNGRVGLGDLESRDGDSATSNVTGSASTQTVVGREVGYFDGVLTMFVALGDSNGNKTTVYKTTDLATWTVVTPSSGGYGDTRLTHSSSTQVYFSIVKDRSEVDYTEYDMLIIQNGVDSPRIYAKANWAGGPAASGSYLCAVLLQPAVVDSRQASVKPFWYRYFNMSAGGAGTITNADASKLNISFAGSPYRFKIELHKTYTTTVRSSFVASALGDFNGVQGFKHCRQIILIADHDTSDTFWQDNVIIELIDNVTLGGPYYHKIYDPSDGTGSVSLTAVTGGTHCFQCVYTLPATNNSGVAGDFNLDK